MQRHRKALHMHLTTPNQQCCVADRGRSEEDPATQPASQQAVDTSSNKSSRGIIIEFVCCVWLSAALGFWRVFGRPAGNMRHSWRVMNDFVCCSERVLFTQQRRDATVIKFCIGKTGAKAQQRPAGAPVAHPSSSSAHKRMSPVSTNSPLASSGVQVPNELAQGELLPPVSPPGSGKQAHCWLLCG